VLNANRNPAWSKAAVEAELRAQLGVETIIWLPYGSRLGVTDGHVDGVCVFAGPGRVLLRVPDDPSDPDYDRMRENRRVLADARDARGRELEVIELPHHPVAEVDGVPARVIGYGGGGVHCITQQVPRA
jgi:agmatine deiminase